MSKEELLTNLPLLITYENEPLVYVAKPEDVIPLTDLHPRVRTMLKALEAKARVGMPKPTLVAV